MKATSLDEFTAQDWEDLKQWADRLSPEQRQQVADVLVEKRTRPSEDEEDEDHGAKRLCSEPSPSPPPTPEPSTSTSYSQKTAQEG